MEGKMKLEIDERLCAGCRICQMACDLTYNKKTGILNPKRAHIKIVGQLSTGGFKIELEECTQCAMCAKFCPTGALLPKGDSL